MIIDFIALVLLALAFFKGFRKGLIVALFSFIAFIIGLTAALKLSSLAAKMISEHANIGERWLPMIAFLVVFILVVLLVRIGARIIEAAVKMVMLGWLNRLGGVIMYMLIYFFIFSIFLFYLSQLNIIKETTIGSSVTYPYIQPIAPKLMKVMAAVFPFLKNTFQDLLQFFDHVST